MSRHLFALAVMLTSASAVPAQSQVTAEGLLTADLEERRVSKSRYEIQPRDWPVRYWDGAAREYRNYDGLRLSSAMLGLRTGTRGNFTHLVVAANASDQPLCVRGKVLFEPSARVRERDTANTLIQPGGHVVLTRATGDFSVMNFDEFASVAFWKPDPSAPGSDCTASAPTGLESWADSTERLTFVGSHF